MKRWGIPALLGLVLLAVVGFWGYRQYQSKVALMNDLNNKNQFAFHSLTGKVQNLATLLGKSTATSGHAEDAAIFADIWQQSSGAKENLNQLPVNSVVVGRTSKFLTQVGDFSHSLSESLSSGNTVSQKQYDTLNSLYRQAGDLNRDLQNIQAKISDGKMGLSELTEETKGNLKKGQPATVASSFQVVDRDMQSYPTLIYDGPFSDHMEKIKPQGLAGGTINADRAKSIAGNFVDRYPNVNYRSQIANQVKGKIPAFRVELVPEGNKAAGRINADVSKQGGTVIWYLDERNIGAPRITVETARQKAAQFLASRGYSNMENIYYVKQDSRIVLNFTYVQNGIPVYADQIKVTVALDNGQIVGFDARGYVMAHHSRSIPAPKIKMDQARQRVNPRMKIASSRLTLIPTDYGAEKLAYEFKGTINKDSYIVYVDALDGKTDQILKVVQSKDGVLTM